MILMTEELITTSHRVIVTFWGLVALVCFIIGCPANLIAFTFFTRYKKSRTSGILYILITLIDALICGFGLVIGVSGVLNNSKVCNIICVMFI